MGKFEDSKYYKSKEHLENAKNASIKGKLKIQELKEKRIKEYYENPKSCKECGEVIPYNKKRESLFCNKSCSATYNNKNRIVSESQKLKTSLTQLNNNKITKKLVLNNIIRICLNCQKEFIVKRNNGILSSQKYCCKECSNKGMKLNVSLSQKEKVKNGTHKGWQSRKTQSYPEKFFTDVLNNNNLNYEPNFVINKRNLGLNDVSNYFLDFYFEDKRIDLEIDGKQHNYKDRKESDEIRDKLLENIGIKVFRIEWKNPNNDKNKEYVKNEINRFLEFFNSY